MTDILQDDDGDINVTNNRLGFVNGADEVEQLLRQRLRTFFGEWFLDRNDSNSHEVTIG